MFDFLFKFEVVYIVSGSVFVFGVNAYSEKFSEFAVE